MPTAKKKTENLSCRVSSEHKNLIERAALLSGFSLSDFILHATVSTAAEMIQSESVIKLTREEWDRLTSSLDQSGREPGESTKKAVELFNQGCDNGDSRSW
ncbi:MAG: type II toxin-antitoxin system TacA family antitoxin [Armatimonadota bacterium]